MAMTQMLCVLGQQDIPVIQEQPPFTVDLLDTNLLLFGMAMSGKTNLIKLLVTILHKRYRETEEQIFILDFGSALAECEELPLVAAYFDNANEEYVKRVFKLMEEQLKSNIQVLKGRNYRTCKEGQPKHTTLFIDNVNVFLEEPRYTAYQEKLAQLCRDGLSKGITVVLTAASAKGLGGLMNSFKQKIALELPVDNYMEIFNHKVIPVGNHPGRGYANVTVKPESIAGTFPLQAAYELQLYIADSIADPEFQNNLKNYFKGRTVKKYKRFPEKLTGEEYQNFTSDSDIMKKESGYAVSVGLDYTECKPVVLDYESAKIIAVYGKKAFGKTNLLKRLVKAYVDDPKYRFVLLDDGRGELEKLDEKIADPARKTYIQGYEERTLHYTTSKGEDTVSMKLSPMQLFIKCIHEQYMDLSAVRRQVGNLALGNIFGYRISTPLADGQESVRNTVFVLQSKYLYVNSAVSKEFMDGIFPLLAARADEMNWIFLFTDVKNISDGEVRSNFHSTISTAFLLDNIAEFVGERGGKSIFGTMDVKSLKEEYAQCELGDGYYYSIEKDDLKKLKFIKEGEGW